MTHEPDAEVVIVYPPEMLPPANEDVETDVIVDGVIIYSTDGGNMDWADEIAQDILRSGAGQLSKNAATQLRKAKSDGMVTAADLIKAHRHAAPKFSWMPKEKALFNKIDSLLREHASKLESPTD